MAPSPTTFSYHESHTCCPLHSHYSQVIAVMFCPNILLLLANPCAFQLFCEIDNMERLRGLTNSSLLDNCPAKMHPIIHLTILAAAFHLSGLVRCASALPTFAVATNFSFMSCTTMTYPTPQETVLSHLFRQIIPFASGQEAHLLYLFFIQDISTFKELNFPARALADPRDIIG